MKTGPIRMAVMDGEPGCLSNHLLKNKGGLSQVQETIQKNPNVKVSGNQVENQIIMVDPKEDQSKSSWKNLEEGKPYPAGPRTFSGEKGSKGWQ